MRLKIIIFLVFLLFNIGFMEEISTNDMAEDEMDFLIKHMMLPYYQRLHELKREKEDLQSQHKLFKQEFLQCTSKNANQGQVDNLPQISLDFVIDLNDQLTSTDEQQKLFKVYKNKLDLKHKEKEIQEFEQRMTRRAQELKKNLDP